MSCFAALPEAIREQARRAYQLWRANPSHPSLRFKQVQGHENIYSVRIGLAWRALGRVDGDTITWFWIGSHADYDNLIG
jgi:hypothetical protein